MRSVDVDSYIKELFRGARLQHIPKGEVIYSSDAKPTFFRVISGFAKRYFITRSGEIGVQSIYGPGDIFSFTTVFKVLFDQDLHQGAEVYYYESVTKMRIQCIDAESLRVKIGIDSAMMHKVLLYHAGRWFYSNTQFLEILRLHGAYAKTAHQLAYFGIRFGEKTDEGIRITIPLTHQDIADIIGSTRETVTAAMIKLREKNIISTNHYIYIRDLEGLLEESFV